MKQLRRFDFGRSPSEGVLNAIRMSVTEVQRQWGPKPNILHIDVSPESYNELLRRWDQQNVYRSFDGLTHIFGHPAYLDTELPDHPGYRVVFTD